MNTNNRIMAPCIIWRPASGMLTMVKKSSRTVIMIAPATVPRYPPFPPLMAVPPMITAAIVFVL